MMIPKVYDERAVQPGTAMTAHSDEVRCPTGGGPFSPCRLSPCRLSAHPDRSRCRSGYSKCRGCKRRSRGTGIEQHLAFEQRAQHVEQAIGNAAQGACMIVAACAQRRIALFAPLIMLNGDPCPMIGRGLQTRVAGMALDDDATLAAALGDRSHAQQRPQGVVISPPQGLAGLGEQRGDVDPSEPWIGTQDRDVALLAYLPRRGLGRGFRWRHRVRRAGARSP